MTNQSLPTVRQETTESVFINDKTNPQSSTKILLSITTNNINNKITTPYSEENLTNSFINSHFTYCPLIWMFSSNGCYKTMNKIYERSLRLFLITMNHHFIVFFYLKCKNDSSTLHKRFTNQSM